MSWDNSLGIFQRGQANTFDRIETFAIPIHWELVPKSFKHLLGGTARDDDSFDKTTL